ncbi:fibronectin type III domain-containing protein [Marinobacter sp.]|uniref:fibronectin type III domain-containing protein n=1 Tax=Marinobacter sp. TaxID=50741 RepID=UPI0035684C3B
MMSSYQTSTSRNLLIALTLVLAGCGDNSSAGNDVAGGSVADPAARETRDAFNDDVGNSASQKYVQPAQEPDRGPEIENPILAAPLPVPVPEGEGPGAASGDHADPDRPTDDEPGTATEQRGQDDTGAVAGRPVLHWDSPMSREDGSKLYPGEISGYRVYYRLRHQDRFLSLELEGPDTDSLTLDEFDPGAYEFAVSTVDINGMESRRSEPVTVDLI